MPRTAARAKTLNYAQWIGRSHRLNQRAARGCRAIDERVLRITSAYLPPRERTAKIARVHAEWAERAAAGPRASTTYYPVAEPNEGRGVHFGIEWRYPSAGTFRLATSKGDILATCTVYSDDDADYQAICQTLTAILDQKDPVAASLR